MVCPNCGKETEGLKVNNGLFCSNCGAALESLVAAERPVVESTIKPPPLPPEPKRITKAGEEIKSEPLNFKSLDDELSMINELQAELGPTETPPPPKPEPPKLDAAQKDIVKHNRPRVPQNIYEDGFLIVPGEPDIIKEPEIEPPVAQPDSVDISEIEKNAVDFTATDINPTFIENNEDLNKEGVQTEEIKPAEISEPEEEFTETQENLQVSETQGLSPEVIEESETEDEIPEDITEDIPRMEEQHIEQSLPEEKSPTEIETSEETTETPLKNIKAKEKHQKVLFDFLKNGAKQTSKKRKIKKKKHNIKKFLIIIFILFSVCLLVGAFVFYMNTNVFNPDAVATKAEKSFGQNLRPKYLPAGYELSFETSGDSTKLEYIYNYKPATSNTIKITIKKTVLTDSNIYEKIIKPRKPDNWSNDKIKDQLIWVLSDGSIYFIRDSKLYEISSSAKISIEELKKIAEGMF